MSEHHGRNGARKKYKQPIQKYANQEINIKLFCQKEGCNNYTKGTLGYNGAFRDEDGKIADLRNECWYCSEHKNKEVKN